MIQFVHYHSINRLRHRAPIAGIVYVIGMVIILIAHFLLNWIRPAKVCIIILLINCIVTMVTTQLIDRVPRVPPTIAQRNQFNNDL